MIYKNKQQIIGSTIHSGDKVLDVGFWGQGTTIDKPNWPHNLIRKAGADTYGLDLDFDTKTFQPPRYLKASAENFDFALKFDVIFAGDLIEHLSNPGLFLESCERNLGPTGKIIITTPNVFNLFNIASKITHYEPIVNKDETCYFSFKMLRQLAGKNGLKVTSYDYIYDLEYDFRESLKKRFLNTVYKILSIFTDKYIETLVVTLMKP